MRRLTLTLLFLLAWPATAAADDYPDLVEALEAERVELGSDEDVDAARAEIERRMTRLADEWMGTKWGLGAPQADEPGDGKINCGMFVATVLGDAGFRFNRVKLQRQPAELIIKTFSRPNDIARFRNASMEKFLGKVRSMGDGYYIIGLDFHVGFLRVEGDEVRFVHASYVTHTVIDEDAAEASPITTSKYRVVGKLLDRRMVKRWLSGKRFSVVGNW